LILTGLWAQEPRYSELGLAMLHFALDGRWSLPQADHQGRKQPEQLLNTHWFYNVESVTRRGDYRDIGEEWAWPQVVPCLEYLAVGGACFDLRTGLGMGIDGCKLTVVKFSPTYSQILLEETLGDDHPVLFKLLNSQHSSALRIVVNNGLRELSPCQAEQGIILDLQASQTMELAISC
jgi:hypothetical protein